jgi:hypothetical protein
MLQGRFGNTTGSPYLEGRIFFPRLGLRGLVSFLVDTGADGSVLMPADSKKLGVNFRSLRNPTTSQGLGGDAKGFTERTFLSFSDNRYVYSYLLDVEIAASTRHNQRFPSLLGRDILSQWRSVVEPSRGIITFNPRQWDLRSKI